MRGAYVRLNYEINTVPPALCRDAVAKWVAPSVDYREQRQLRDRVVYAALAVNRHGIAELAALSDQPPATGPFLRGRVESADTSGVRVRYGIEAYFMNQAAAQQMEADGNRKAGAPMNVTVAVGSSGTAVLKDTAWEPLGITFAIDRLPPRNADDPQRWQQRLLTGMTVTLHNYSDHDVAIVNLPGAKSFRMVPNERVNTSAPAGVLPAFPTRFRSARYLWTGETREVPKPRADDILVLKPGQTHFVHLDLTHRDWWIIDATKPGAEPIPMQQVQDSWVASFRIEYVPPDAEAIHGFPGAELVRHAPLRSRAFNAAQGVD
jgi:uncharacterized membrane-anchored protein